MFQGEGKMKSEYIWPAITYSLKLQNLTVSMETTSFNPSVLWFTCAELQCVHATGLGAPTRQRFEFELRHKSSMPFPVAARSKAWVCGRSLARIAPGAWVFFSCECCVLSGRRLSDEPITCPEESYRLWCVWVRSGSLDNEEAIADWGLLCSGGEYHSSIINTKNSVIKCLV